MASKKPDNRWTRLKAPFPIDLVKWRPGATTKDKKKGLALAYVDARAVQERLDEVFGPQGWCSSTRHEAGKGWVCRLEIDGTWKEDGAEETDLEATKGGISDAFKRAAVQWGIGRYLYAIDSPWVSLNGKKIDESEMPRLREILQTETKARETFPLQGESSAADAVGGAVSLSDEVSDGWYPEPEPSDIGEQRAVQPATRGAPAPAVERDDDPASDQPFKAFWDIQDEECLANLAIAPADMTCGAKGFPDWFDEPLGGPGKNPLDAHPTKGARREIKCGYYAMGSIGGERYSWLRFLIEKVGPPKNVKWLKFHELNIGRAKSLLVWINREEGKWRPGS